jgi:hypothetical protein
MPYNARIVKITARASLVIASTFITVHAVLLPAIFLTLHRFSTAESYGLRLEVVLKLTQVHLFPWFFGADIGHNKLL